MRPKKRLTRWRYRSKIPTNLILKAMTKNGLGEKQLREPTVGASRRVIYPFPLTSEPEARSKLV